MRPSVEQSREELASVIRRVAALRREITQMEHSPAWSAAEPAEMDEPGAGDRSDMARGQLGDKRAELDTLVSRAAGLVADIMGSSSRESGSTAAPPTLPAEDPAPEGILTPRAREHRLLHRRIVEIIQEIEQLERACGPSRGAAGTKRGPVTSEEVASEIAAVVTDRESRLRELLCYALELGGEIPGHGRAPAAPPHEERPAHVVRSREGPRSSSEVGATVRPETEGAESDDAADTWGPETAGPRSNGWSTESGQRGVSVRVIQPTNGEGEEAGALGGATLVLELGTPLTPVTVRLPTIESTPRGRGRGPAGRHREAWLPLALLSILALGIGLLALGMIGALWAGAITPRAFVAPTVQLATGTPAPTLPALVLPQ